MISYPSLAVIASFIKTRWWILVVVILILLVILGQFINYFLVPKTVKSPSWNNIVIGQTTVNQLRSQFGDLLQQDPQQYLLPTEPELRPHQILSDNQGRVVLVKRQLITPEKLSGLLAQYGQPGSVLYGDDATAGFLGYLYPKQGLLIIASQRLDEAIEIWYFSPTSVEGFLQSYGQSFTTAPPPQF